MSSKIKPFVFAFVMCVICSLALTGAASGLKARQTENIRIDKQKNILKALGKVEAGKKYKKSDVAQLYTTNVKECWIAEDGSVQESKSEGALPIYIVYRGDSISRYAIPFAAYGLWSWVYGYIAFEGDGTTVAGFTVYQHAETPGLGGEVEKAWFQNQFVGKKIVDRNGEFVSIGVVKGKVEDRIPANQRDNYVDGMSGATITGDGVAKYLKEDLAKYEKFVKKLRRRS